MEKTCPRCGVYFACLHDSIMDCHCTSVPLNKEQRIYIADNFDGCLCKDCLWHVKESIATDQDNEQGNMLL